LRKKGKHKISIKILGVNETTTDTNTDKITTKQREKSLRH